MAHSSLLVCPKNLKECIDWVLRATGKDKTGTDNDIDKLNKALEAELPSFNVNSDDLTQLVQGLCLFMGYPSCLCSLKANVDESLKDISRKLKKDSEAVQSCVSISKLDLNCNSCIPKEILCKCCVIRCIKAVKKCGCLKGKKTSCHCKDSDVSCAKVLAGLEACLHLQCLQSDMEDICQCNAELKCCKTGTCTQASGGSGTSCNFCKNLQTKTPVATTGLGLSPPNPIRLAGRLEGFFGSTGQKPGCTCKCGSNPGKSCCCLACDKDQCVKACSCVSKTSCNKSGNCPRKKFCKAIDGIKIAAESKERTCCDSGHKCHCGLDPQNCQSGCCVVSDSKGSQHSVKCMIRRVVKFFASFDPSKPGCPKLCCEIFCVLKCCEFLRDFYNKGGKKCSKCNGKGPCNGSTLKPPSKECCRGNPSACKSGNCCQGCQDCDAIKFSRALKALRFAGPCGQDLYRALDDFLNFIRNVFMGHKDFIRNTVLEAVNSCSNCKKSETDSKTWKACECSSGTPCKACDTLLKDSKLMSILRHGYVSSYVNSKWESLCQKSSSSKCCCGRDSCSCSKSSSSCCKSPSASPCDPSQCCPDCPQRKAAKIFLGMLPCLYYGLKILYDRSQDPVTWPDWQYISVSNGLPSSDLGRFLYAWGYDLRPLISKKGSEFPPMLENLFSSGSLNSLYEKSKIYFTSFPSRSLSSGSSVPSTVRQMLLWLYGLRFQKHFSDIVENSKSLCSPFGNSFNSDAFCYYIYTCCFLLPVAIISLIEDSLSITSLHSEFSKFFYPSDPSDLFEKLCEYARKIFVALAFLYYQCERNAGQGGWNDCAFGRQCAQKFQENSSGSPSTSVPSTSSSGSGCSCPNSGAYLCTAINKDTVHDHCKDGQTCLGFGSCTQGSAHSSGTCTPCPHPLMRFLIDDSSESKSKDPQNFRTPFHSSTVTPMGFKTEHLPEKARKGQDLYHAIYGFCKDGFYPLTRLVQFILCVSRYPETLGELFAFFRKFAAALNSKSELSSNFVEWINGEPGFYSGSALKKALEDLYGSQDSHSGDHSVASLFSLSGCHANKGSGASCGPYLHALTEDVSGVFTPKLCSMYLSWVCYSAEKFYSEFKAFYEEAEKKFKTCSDCKSCQKIVECPCALPFLYSQGFTFHSPGGLNCVNAQGQEHKNNEGKEKHSEGDEKCTTKSCSQFLTQLGLVANGNLFTKLLKEIESFLWSIREPFFLFVLAFWAFVISYFLYVQLYKLDVLELNSHDHPAWSFKILPSTLFSDASSKLKDLSYFTL